MIITSDFEPAWWLKNPHGQTLWPYLFKYRNPIKTQRERLELPDGDFIDLNWVGSHRSSAATVLVLHGLGGDISSHYAQRIIRALSKHHYRVCFMHFRGCSEEPNRLPRGYHSGETEDVAFVAKQLRERFPSSPLAVVGFSLGANVLLKWLGEEVSSAPVDTAVAVSTPFELAKVAERLKSGFSLVYQNYLLQKLRRSILRKKELIADHIDYAGFQEARDFRSFDNAVTAPLHGFESAEDYYSRCSSRPFLKCVEIPTLIIHALDDPFMSPDIVPKESELSSHIELEVTQRGGHVGFISGRNPQRPHYWLTERIPEFINEVFS